MTPGELFETSEAVAYAILQAAADRGLIPKERAKSLALATQFIPVIEAVLRERIGSVGDLRGEIID